MLAAMKLQAASVLVTLGLVLSATGSPTSHPQSLQRRCLPPPLPGCTPYTPFHYVGCFIEENPTFLVYNTGLDFGTMTIEICTNTCKVGPTLRTQGDASADLAIVEWLQICRPGILRQMLLWDCSFCTGIRQ